MVNENKVPRRQFSVADVSFLKYQAYYDSKKNKYGIADSSGNILVDAKYDDVHTNYNNTFNCTKNGQFGVIDIKENIIIPFGKYQSIDSPRNGLIAARKFGYWGFITEYDEIVVPFQFSHVTSFLEGRAFVQKELEGNYAIIDSTGKFYSDYVFTCNNTCCFRKNECLVYYKNQFMDIIDRFGKPTFGFNYEQLMFVQGDENSFWVKKEKLWGKVSKENKILSPFEYENISFSNGKLIGLKNSVWMELK